MHKDSISVGILNPGHESADVEKIFNDEESVRRLIGRFPQPRLLWACTRRARRATTCIACSSRWGCAAR